MLARLNFLIATFVIAPGVLLYSAGAGQKPKKPIANTSASSFEREILPVLKQYCIGCHGKTNPAGGVSLVGVTTDAGVIASRERWEQVLRNVQVGTMPPAGLPHPSEPARLRFMGYLEGIFRKLDCRVQDPGRVTMRRLNREEYNNTIHDLMGIDLRPADDFPSDDVGYGFDNIGDVLSISPLLMEKYISAAEKIARAAILAPEDVLKVDGFDGSQISSISAGIFANGGRILATNGAMWVDYDFAKPGKYTIKIDAFGQQAGNEPPNMVVKLDDKEIYATGVKNVERTPASYTTPVQISSKGKHRVSIEFTNDFYDPNAKSVNRRDRNLIVNRMEIKCEDSGLPDVLPASHRRILFTSHKDRNRQEVAKQILKAFVGRAFRRPATENELRRLVKYVVVAEEQGESFERGIQLAVQATLCSPYFLFRVEQPAPANAKGAVDLSPYELASRLSYFVWSSMPDEELLAAAAKGTLKNPEVLAHQAKRMLKDPKAKGMTQNFAGQWLQLRKLAIVNPDTALFPAFTPQLRQSMKRETELFFDEVVRQDRSILDFIDGKFTYVDGELAKFYGIPNIDDKEFHRVQLVGDQRLGILTQASILTVTSNPTRTSPVKRGKWILENILGTPPPPPLPNVGELEDDKKTGKALVGTLRQRMEQHRKNAICASCHSRMDPIGFGMENFNAVGQWRDKEGMDKIDSSGTLPGGQSFQGPVQLIRLLKTKQSLFVHNFAEKMLTYALGRGLERTDRCHVEAVMKAAQQQNFRFSAVVTAIVQSDAFRKRRTGGGA